MLRRSAGTAATTGVLRPQQWMEFATRLAPLRASLSTVASEATTSSSAAPVAAAAAAASEAASEGAETTTKPRQSLLWRLVKSGLMLATTAAVGGTAYVTYGMVLFFFPVPLRERRNLLVDFFDFLKFGKFCVFFPFWVFDGAMSLTGVIQLVFLGF